MNLQTAHEFYAQFGEDKILDEFFGHKTDGFFVEVGAYNGLDDSNTAFFESRGWTGVLVEADPQLAAMCAASRPNSYVAACAAVAPDSPPEVEFEILDGWKTMSSLKVQAAMLRRVVQFGDAVQIRRTKVPAKTLDRILAEATEKTKSPSPLDFISFDVEGAEWDALQGFTLDRWKPQIVLIERNTHFPHRQIWRHLHAHRYRYLHTTGVNDWFVRIESATSDLLSAAEARRLFFRFWLPKYLTVWKPVLFLLRDGLRVWTVRLGIFHLLKKLLRQKN